MAKGIPEYTVVAKELPFSELIGLIKSSVGMSTYLELPVRIPLPFYEKIIETRSLNVIHDALEGLKEALGEAQLEEEVVNHLHRMMNTNKLDEVYIHAHDLIVEFYDGLITQGAMQEHMWAVQDYHQTESRKLREWLKKQSGAVVPVDHKRMNFPAVVNPVEGALTSPFDIWDADGQVKKPHLADRLKKDGLTREERTEAELIGTARTSVTIRHPYVDMLEKVADEWAAVPLPPVPPSLSDLLGPQSERAELVLDPERIHGQNTGPTRYVSPEGVEFVVELLLPKIVRQHREMDGVELVGWNVQDTMYKFFGNVKLDRVAVIYSAIWRSGLMGKFAVAEEAFGYNETTLAEWQLDEHVAFFHVCSKMEIERFNKARTEVIAAFPTFKSDVL